MTVQEYFGDWSKAIDTSEADRLLKSLSRQKQSVCPQIKDVFKAFTLCSLHSLRVVIIGQDPYPDIKNGLPVATGIAFGNSPTTKKQNYSPSLDILMDSVIDFTRPHEYINFDASLENWEKQGVLMLNSALSCQAGKIGSHSLMWRPFMISFLSNLSVYTSGVVYVLMGSAAQSLEPYINPRFNHLIKIQHPAYFVRNKKRMPSDLWKQINSILIGQNGYGITWYNEFKDNEKVFYEGN